LKRPYVTEGDLESCHIHGAEDVTSPKKTNTEHSPTSSESDESRKLHHLKKKKKKKKHKKHKHNHGKDGHNIRQDEMFLKSRLGKISKSLKVLI